MRYPEGDIRNTVVATKTWQNWRSQYELKRFFGKGDEPFSNAEAWWAAIPPDTYASIMRDLREEGNRAYFGNIVAELSPQNISAVLEHYSAFAKSAVMLFFLNKVDTG